MNRTMRWIGTALMAVSCCAVAAAPPAKPAPKRPGAKKPAPKKPKKPAKVYKAYTDAESAGEDFQIMGDYEGKKMVAQVLALGKGEFSVNVLTAFDQRSSKNAKPILAVLTGKLAGGKVSLGGKPGWTATIEGGKLTGNGPDGAFEMKKVTRLSPALGAKPPAGAVVLLDGKSLDAFEGTKGKPNGWKLIDGAMRAMPGSGSVISKKKFTDHKVHVEFRSPFMPDARGQSRGNSGVYLQGRYEVQVLDSYALAGMDNECGGIYKVAPPRVNMCAPPLQWQTYDITFHAVKVKDGKVVAPARITVVHNGVTIHDNVALPNVKATRGGLGGADGQGGGIYLQDHKNPVEYRNIWVVELTD